MIFIIGIIWYLSGVASVIYWITRTDDFKIGDIAETLFAGLYGPVAYLIGYVYYAESINFSEIVLFKKRQ